MGKFETINFEEIKSYTLFSKNSFNQILALSKNMPVYSLYGEGRDVKKEIYLDSPNNLLLSAGIILSKVIEEGKAYFKVEREGYLSGIPSLTRQKKVFIHPIGIKDTVFDHSLFLIEGITSMFSTKFYIDLDNVLKTVSPKLEIENRRTHFKVFSGRGFKAEMIYEDVRCKNYDTKRKAQFWTIDIKHTSSKINLNEFNSYIANLEKYCKEVIPTYETKYQTAKKMTTNLIKK